MVAKDPFITWHDEQSKAEAMASFSNSVDAYNPVYKATSDHLGGRNFINIEPNKSVRPGFTRQDYDAFRPAERIPKDQKRAMAMCMEAYDKVGIIRNVIDLMGDFGSQGIDFVHENKSVEKFYKNWFKKVDGKERSERFLNILYRTGNTISYRSSAKITPKVQKYIKSIGAEAPDILVKSPKFDKNLIPWRYTFFNPLSVNLKDGNLNLFFGRKEFHISPGISKDNFKGQPANVLDSLPPDIKERMLNGDKQIPLDPDRLSVYYYKKDDWNLWANPMILAILDDIVMLEKMRLADMSALDGAISNVRLWTLGNLQEHILPTKAAITKLQNVLASNVGGGTMELVWGPELTYTESNSQVYKFLGSEKYSAVLNGIYAGLGVPPTLTGMAGNGGGFTNNFISLKTLVERLQYGRGQLIKFWEREVEIVRKAMGFRKPAHIIFDQMSLSDEAAEKALLIQLADRDIISTQTLQERFKEIPDIERIRLQRESQDREDDKAPQKAGPYHDPQHEMNLEKIGLQAGSLMPADVGLETSIPENRLYPPDPDKPPAGTGAPSTGPKKSPSTSKKPSSPNGRPSNKKDNGPRKRRVDKPKSKPGVAEFIVWAQDSFNTVSDLTNTAYLQIKDKKSMRQLTKDEVGEVEALKLDVLSNLNYMADVTEASIYEILSTGRRAHPDLTQDLADRGISVSQMTMDEYKKRVVGLYIEYAMQQ